MHVKDSTWHQEDRFVMKNNVANPCMVDQFSHSGYNLLNLQCKPGTHTEH